MYLHLSLAALLRAYVVSVGRTYHVGNRNYRFVVFPEPVYCGSRSRPMRMFGEMSFSPPPSYGEGNEKTASFSNFHALPFTGGAICTC